jgi:hypothetical protein
MGWRALEGSIADKRHQQKPQTSRDFSVRREGVMTLKRIMTSVGALRSTLGRSPEEKVDAADLDFNSQMHGV